MKMLLLVSLALTFLIDDTYAFAPHPPIITTNECCIQEITYPDFGDRKISIRAEIPPPTFMERYDKWCYEAPQTYTYWMVICSVAVFAVLMADYAYRRRKRLLKK